jgi:flavoprotein
MHKRCLSCTHFAFKQQHIARLQTHRKPMSKSSGCSSLGQLTPNDARHSLLRITMRLTLVTLQVVAHIVHAPHLR